MSFAKATLTQSQLFNDNRYLVKSEAFTQSVLGNITFQGSINFDGETYFSNDIHLDDNVKIYLGDDDDSGIFYDGSKLILSMLGLNAIQITGKGDIGVVASLMKTWHSGYTAIQIGQGGAVWSGTATIGTFFTDNAYYDGDWRAIVTGEASIVALYNGHIVFYSNTGLTGGGVYSTTVAAIWLSTGNIGFGIAAPNDRLELSFSTSGINGMFISQYGSTGSSRVFIYTNGTGDAFTLYQAGGTYWSAGVDNSDSDRYKISKNSTLGTSDFLQITGTGEVGIEVNSMKAWQSGYSALQIGQGGALWSATSAVSTYLTDNAHYDGSWRAIVSGGATAIVQYTGLIAFYQDTGLTGGNAYSPTISAIWTAAGDVGFGTSSPADKLNLAFNTSGVNGILVDQKNTGTGSSRVWISTSGTGNAYTLLHAGGTYWATGIDNADADSYKISQSTTLGGAPRLTLTTGGNCTIPGRYTGNYYGKIVMDQSGLSSGTYRTNQLWGYCGLFAVKALGGGSTVHHTKLCLVSFDYNSGTLVVIGDTGDWGMIGAITVVTLSTWAFALDVVFTNPGGSSYLWGYWIGLV